MLVLSRKAGEAIVIENVEVKILSIKGDKISVGITAPKEIQVLRKELKGKVK